MKTIALEAITERLAESRSDGPASAVVVLLDGVTTIERDHAPAALCVRSVKVTLDVRAVSARNAPAPALN